MEPWFKSNPARLAYELAALRSAGIAFKQDERALADGKVVLHLTARINDDSLRLTAHFPDCYPYFRFELRAPSLNLRRHQHPLGKNLCLLGRATRNWNPSDTLAAFVTERVPKTIAAAEAPIIDEEQQGEPATDYFPYTPNSILLIDTAWSIPGDSDRGNLLIGVEQHDLGKHVIRGAVLRVRDREKTTLAEADPAIAVMYPHQISGNWYRLQSPPLFGDPNDAVAAVRATHKNAFTQWWPVGAGAKANVTGIVFPEEVQRGTYADAWIFIIQVQVGKRVLGSYYARAGRAGRSDIMARIPELRPLKDKTVGIIGLGCVGAPSALHFARSGIGELRMIDHDYIEPGTTVRWPLGVSCAGHQKAPLIEDMIKRHWPYTRTKSWDHRIGDPDSRDAQVLDEFLTGLELVYDASVEHGVNHLLSDLASKRGIPYVAVSTTPGAWGGRVVLVPSTGRGCWQCLLHATADESIPSPPASPVDIQPAGCPNPTYAGAGFDAEEVALMGLRTSIAALTAEYPSAPSDVGILSLRNEEGLRLEPHWDWYDLRVHPACQNKHS